MKLNIGENIRKYRKQQDMTQEQLADKLGVAYQTVSRWESGSFYPDIELLPAIADVFSLTMDELMGMPEAKKEEQAKKIFDELQRECIKDEYDAEHIVTLLREIRRHYVSSHCAWRVWINGNDKTFMDPIILKEMRLLAKAYLARRPMNADVIERMVSIENEEHLPAFLEEHTFPYDCSERNLLFWRYYRRQDAEKLEPERKYSLFHALDILLSEKHLIGIHKSEKSTEMSAFALSLLDLLREGAEDTEPDMWTEARLFWGMKKAELLLTDGKTAEALALLEQCVELLKKTMKIKEKVLLPTSCRFLAGMEWNAEEYWMAPHNDPDLRPERAIMITNNMHRLCTCFMVIPSTYYDTLLGGAFDALRNNTSFTALTQRVKALIVTK